MSSMPAAPAISVVVADDQPSIRSLVRNGLQQLGFANIRECGDGEEALRAIVQRPPHLVLSDLNMPVLDGIGLLRAVRGHPPTSKLAFIILSGSTDREMVQKAVQFGVNNYVVKPFTVASLKERIEA